MSGKQSPHRTAPHRQGNEDNTSSPRSPCPRPSSTLSFSTFSTLSSLSNVSCPPTPKNDEMDRAEEAIRTMEAASALLLLSLPPSQRSFHDFRPSPLPSPFSQAMTRLAPFPTSNVREDVAIPSRRSPSRSSDPESETTISEVWEMMPDPARHTGSQ